LESTVTFDPIDAADSGNYTCEVSPVAGNVSGHSSVISLEIQSENLFISGLFVR